MNLIELFETQKALDERIVKEKGLEGVNLLTKKVRALLTEFGELSNEERSFKFWSEDRKPRASVKMTCRVCDGAGYDRYMNGMFDHNTPCERCYGNQNETRNLLLEEYVDCLHFILSIGLEHEFDYHLPAVSLEPITPHDYDIDDQFIMLMQADWEIYEEGDAGYYQEGLELFLGLGQVEMLGFTWDEIEAAYYEKNKINHSRQENNY